MTIQSTMLAAVPAYVEQRAMLLKAIEATGDSQIIDELLAWEAGFDEQAQSWENLDPFHKKLSQYCHRLPLVIALHDCSARTVLARNPEEELKPLSTKTISDFIEMLYVISFYVESNPRGQNIWDRLNPKVQRVGSQCLLIGDLLLAPMRVFEVSKHSHTFLTALAQIPAQANPQQVIKIIRNTGVALYEIDPFDMSRIECSDPISNQIRDIKRTLSLSKHLNARQLNKLTSFYLDAFFFHQIVRSQRLVDLIDFTKSKRLRGQSTNSIDDESLAPFADQVHALVRTRRESFQSLVGEQHKALFERIVLRRLTQTFFANTPPASEKVPSTIFTNPEINTVVLARALPYLFHQRGPHALCSLVPGDEYEAIPQFRQDMRDQCLNSTHAWSRLKHQPDQVVDLLLPTFTQADTVKSLNLLKTMQCLPTSSSLSLFEATVTSSVATRTGDLNAPWFKGDPPHIPADKARNFAAAHANRQRLTHLILERARQGRQTDELVFTDLKNTCRAEMMDVLDYARAKFLSVLGSPPTVAKMRFTTYSQLLSASQRWHRDLYRSQFKDQDMVYFERPLNINSDSVTAILVQTRAELHFQGCMFRNCIYSRHENIVRGESWVMHGELQYTGIKFIAELGWDRDSGVLKVFEMRAPYNEPLDEHIAQVIQAALVVAIAAPPLLSPGISLDGTDFTTVE